MTEVSDIDLLLVLPDEIGHDEATTLIDELASRVSCWTSNDVRPLLYLDREVRSASIFDAVLRERKDIAGDPSWLRGRLRDRSS